MAERDGETYRETVRRALAVSGWASNAVGAVVVSVAILFVVPVFTDDVGLGRLAAVIAPAGFVYFMIVGSVNHRLLNRNLERASGWLVEERVPTETELRATLGLAGYSTKVAAVAWAGGVPLFGLIGGVLYGLDLGVVMGGVLLLGAETTCALYYLNSERILRPMTGRVLALRTPGYSAGPGLRGRLAGGWWLATGVPLFGMVVVGFVALIGTDVDATYIGAAVVFLGLLATATGALATQLTAKAIAEPVEAVGAGIESVQAGELDARVAVDDGSEIGRLQAGFNRMAEGLAERERIRDLFGRQVGEDVARAALDDGARLGGEERVVGAFFVDIIGSTAMAVERPPTEVVEVLNRFFHVVVDTVESDGALVNKFEGDAALCVFGAPAEVDDPAGDALRSARRLAQRLREEIPELDFGIGVSAGQAVAGNVGAERRFEYTVIGDPINEASRLSELAKDRSGRLLASESALELAAGAEREAWAVTDRATLRGRSEPTGLAEAAQASS